MHHARIPHHLPIPAASLRRIDPTQNAARFYSMDVERDQFCRVVLVRRWGRIGTFGKVRLTSTRTRGGCFRPLWHFKTRMQRKGYR